MDLAQSSSVATRTSVPRWREHELDALIVSGSEYSGFEGAVTYMSGFQIVHRYAYVVVPADGDAVRSSSRPRRATSASTGRRRSSRSSTRARRAHRRAARATRAGSAIGVYGLDYIMAVRDYQALDGPRPRRRSTSSSTSPAPSRATPSSSPCATRCGSTSDGFEVWLRGLRAGQDRGRGDGGGRGVVHRRGLRPADDEHGADGHRHATRGPSSRSPARTRCSAIRARRRSRSPARACTGSRSRAPSAPRTPSRPDDTKRMMEAVRRVLRGGARRRCAPARRCHDVHIAPSRRASPTAATTSATSPATRSG